jgi:signal transduction histidine kinase
MGSFFSAAQDVDRTASRFGPGAAAMFSFLAACGVVTLVADGEIADAAGAVGVLIGSAVTGAVFLRRARVLDGRERFGWSLIGIGILIAAFGVLVVAVMFFATGDAPAFGWTDLFFFVSYGAIATGFGSLPHTQGSPLERVRMLIDGTIGAVFLGALMLVYLVPSLMQSLETSSLVTRVVGGLYPFADLVVLTIALLVLLRRSAHRFDVRVALFSVGLVAQVIGDVIFVASAESGSFEDTEPLYVMNLMALAAIFAAAYLLRVSPPLREYAERNPSSWILVAPYLSAVGMLAVFIVDTLRSPAKQAHGVLLAATVLVGLLVIARQGVAIVENRRYVERHRNVLVSTISHELRTPLTAISGFVDLLREDGDSLSRADQSDMLDIVHSQAEYMSRIVADLIMLARDAGNDIDLRVEPVQMSEFALASIQASGVSEGVVAVECPPDLVGYVDPSRLQQLVVNLLTNASRYGGSKILVRIELRGSSLVVEVHDDGAGIPRRHEVRVWDRFERGPHRLNAATPGSGIGLAIVAAVAESHGGTATYRRSRALGGACFEVVLPASGIPADGLST